MGFAPLSEGDPARAGGYALRARIGAGGMGRVYLAFSPGGWAVAVKVVRPEYADDPEFRRRFQQEVRAARRVQGRYTAPVVDADTDAALPWLATAYVPGPALGNALAEHGPFSPATVFRLLAGVAEGLSAVHACGIVHRDLKPANVLLAADGPRVIDFGIAHAADASTVTRADLRIGTPGFMAPEQIRGLAITGSVDVFALGNLAMIAATGRNAFGDGNPDALFYRIINEDPNLSGCPREVKVLVRRCLAKNPEKRPGLDEVIAYAREQTQGQTMLQAAGSWLPPTIGKTLRQYDPTALLTRDPIPPPEPPKTTIQPPERPNTPVRPPGPPTPPHSGQPPKPTTEPDAPWKGLMVVAAIVAMFAFFGIGPDKVFATIGKAFSDAPATSDTERTATDTQPTRTYAAPAAVATTRRADPTPEPEYTTPAAVRTTRPAPPAKPGECVRVSSTGDFQGHGYCDNTTAYGAYWVTQVYYGNDDCASGDDSWIHEDGYRLCLTPHLVVRYCYLIPRQGWITNATCKTPGTVIVVDVIDGADNQTYCNRDYKWTRSYNLKHSPRTVCVFDY